MIHVIYYAYGAPASVDQVEEFFSHVLNGKKVPGPMLDNLKATFLKSGFPDFIASSSQRIAQGLEVLLTERLQQQVKVYNAYKHTAPFVEDAVELAIANGATKIVTLAINPISSPSGGGAVHTEVANLLHETSIEHIAIDNWHLNEDIVAVYADRVRRSLNWLPTKVHSNAHILFTVHSQQIDEERNKPYIQQFEQLATAIVAKLGVENFHITYRSAHGTEGWLGPDVCTHIRTLHEQGVSGIVTCELLSLTADVESYFEIGVNALAKLIENRI